MEWTIRPFSENDREDVRALCEMSAPRRIRTEQKRLFLRKMQCDYYLDCEPEHCFVASDGEKTVGYILCAADCEQYARRYMERYYPKLKEYSRVQASLARGEVLHYGEHANFFPAHFRLFVRSDCRRQGVGTALVGALREHLSAYNIKGMMTYASKKDTVAAAFALNCGFSLLSGRENPLPWGMDL